MPTDEKFFVGAIWENESTRISATVIAINEPGEDGVVAAYLQPDGTLCESSFFDEENFKGFFPKYVDTPFASYLQQKDRRPK
jgi:hypothetical protein